jgi:hypothetical protein
MDVSAIDAAVAQTAVENQTTAAYWMHKNFCERAAERLGENETDELILETVREFVEFVQISFEDVDPEVFKHMDVDRIMKYEPDETLIRAALGLLDGDPRSVLKDHLGLSSRPTEVYVTLR